MERTPIKRSNGEKAMKRLETKLEDQIVLKGDGTFVSSHECYGKLAEEMEELREASCCSWGAWIKSEEIRELLLNIAVLAVFGVACLEQKEMELH